MRRPKLNASKAAQNFRSAAGQSGRARLRRFKTSSGGPTSRPAARSGSWSSRLKISAHQTSSGATDEAGAMIRWSWGPATWFRILAVAVRLHREATKPRSGFKLRMSVAPLVLPRRTGRPRASMREAWWGELSKWASFSLRPPSSARTTPLGWRPFQAAMKASSGGPTSKEPKRPARTAAVVEKRMTSTATKIEPGDKSISFRGATLTRGMSSLYFGGASKQSLALRPGS